MKVELIIASADPISAEIYNDEFLTDDKICDTSEQIIPQDGRKPFYFTKITDVVQEYKEVKIKLA